MCQQAILATVIEDSVKIVDMANKPKDGEHKERLSTARYADDRIKLTESQFGIYVVIGRKRNSELYHCTPA